MSTERAGIRVGRPEVVPDRAVLAEFVDAHRGGQDEAAAVLAEPFDGAPLTPEELARRSVRRYPTIPAPRRALLVARVLELLATWAPRPPEPEPLALLPRRGPGRPPKRRSAT